MLLTEPGLLLFPWDKLCWDSRPGPPYIAYRPTPPPAPHIVSWPQHRLWTRPGMMGSRELRHVVLVAWFLGWDVHMLATCFADTTVSRRGEERPQASSRQ